MAKDNLPTEVNPFKLAEHATSLHGSIPLKNMERLRPYVQQGDGEVEAEIEFGTDRFKTRYLKASIKTQVVLQCQRCLEPIDYAVQAELTLGLLEDEAKAAELPPSYDPWVVIDNHLSLLEVIEEEILISLPVVPMHDPELCKTHLPIISADKDANIVKENPFKAIASLKNKPE